MPEPIHRSKGTHSRFTCQPKNRAKRKTICFMTVSSHRSCNNNNERKQKKKTLILGMLPKAGTEHEQTNKYSIEYFHLFSLCLLGKVILFIFVRFLLALFSFFPFFAEKRTNSEVVRLYNPIIDEWWATAELSFSRLPICCRAKWRESIMETVIDWIICWKYSATPDYSEKAIYFDLKALQTLMNS